MTWKTKIKVLIREFKQMPYNLRDYGWRYSVVSIISTFVDILGCPNKTKEKWQLKMRYAITSFLQKYMYIYENYRNDFTKNTSSLQDIRTDGYVFVFWGQGLDNAPEIVKACVSSIQSFMKCRVVILDNNSWSGWVKLPDFIIAKFESHEMTYAAFSDVLRFALLAKYGGIWMDATLFLTKTVPEWVYNSKLVTRKGEYTSAIVSACRWTGFFIGGTSLDLPMFVYRYLCEYWYHVGGKGRIIDYFLVDYIMDIAYNNVPEYKKMIDEVPMNNPNIHTIEEMLNDSYTSFYDDTWLYKLTYKKAFLKEIDGCSTFYKVICETRISDNEE